MESKNNYLGSITEEIQEATKLEEKEEMDVYSVSIGFGTFLSMICCH